MTQDLATKQKAKELMTSSTTQKRKETKTTQPDEGSQERTSKKYVDKRPAQKPIVLNPGQISRPQPPLLIQQNAAPGPKEAGPSILTRY